MIYINAFAEAPKLQNEYNDSIQEHRSYKRKCNFIEKFTGKFVLKFLSSISCETIYFV